MQYQFLNNIEGRPQVLVARVVEGVASSGVEMAATPVSERNIVGTHVVLKNATPKTSIEAINALNNDGIVVGCEVIPSNSALKFGEDDTEDVGGWIVMDKIEGETFEKYARSLLLEENGAQKFRTACIDAVNLLVRLDNYQDPDGDQYWHGDVSATNLMFAGSEVDERSCILIEPNDIQVYTKYTDKRKMEDLVVLLTDAVGGVLWEDIRELEEDPKSYADSDEVEEGLSLLDSALFGFFDNHRDQYQDPEVPYNIFMESNRNLDENDLRDVSRRLSRFLVREELRDVLFPEGNSGTLWDLYMTIDRYPDFTTFATDVKHLLTGEPLEFYEE